MDKAHQFLKMTLLNETMEGFCAYYSKRKLTNSSPGKTRDIIEMFSRFNTTLNKTGRTDTGLRSTNQIFIPKICQQLIALIPASVILIMKQSNCRAVTGYLTTKSFAIHSYIRFHQLSYFSR